ncbi:EP300-interacting inhibitor of differentiation 1 [Sciurus carolinensis]|uniref:EP300-interacting inhibitor of differentiation 1 n=1 Tax=Sciurus carolinensis TaxID=30640 RepID=A0AA41MKT0_SCICA|nr:EP300-interacting inhibitor of differentiation 1 [Sciurus carolinensis]
MSEMAELSELYEESNDLQMDVIPGGGDLSVVEVGSGNQEPPLSPSGKVAPATARGGRPSGGAEGPVNGKCGLAIQPNPGEQPGQMAGPDLRARTRTRNLMTGRTTTTILKRSS